MTRGELAFNLDLFFDIKNVEEGKRYIQILKEAAKRNLEDAEMIEEWFEELED